MTASNTGSPTSAYHFLSPLPRCDSGAIDHLDAVVLDGRPTISATDMQQAPTRLTKLPSAERWLSGSLITAGCVQSGNELCSDPLRLVIGGLPRD
jgi:hypothetical protein